MLRIVGTLFLFLLSNIAGAQNSGPTLDKCTCHLTDGEDPSKDGASASNATLCIQSLDQARRWCEITVACLRGNLGPACQAKATPKTALVPLFKQHVESIVVARDASPAIYQSADNAFAAVVEAEKYNSPELDACSLAYLEGKNSVSRTATNFSCSYSADSRWLTISLNTGDQMVRFLFGPQE